MALKAGRVGVAKSEVDEFGHITGGGTPDNVYTKSQCDNKFELKSHIGGLKFRDNDGTAQYMLPNGEWTNFNSGGGGTLGFNIPLDKLQTGIRALQSGAQVISGGYCIDDDGMLYFDFVGKFGSTGSTLGVFGIDLPSGYSLPNADSSVNIVYQTPAWYQYHCYTRGSGDRVDIATTGVNSTETQYRIYGQVQLTVD